MNSNKPDVNKCSNCIFGQKIDDSDLIFCLSYKKLTNDLDLAIIPCMSYVKQKGSRK